MKSKIPSEAEFERASAKMKYQRRGLSEVREQILATFGSSGVLYDFFIIESSPSAFRAYVFYPHDRDILLNQESGIERQIRDSVFEELERVGRGERSAIDVEYEFDSNENVDRNFEGNYYNRLR